MTKEREKSVFVVDNDRFVLDLLKQCVDDMNLGIKVFFASEPVEAVRILARNEMPPDLILLNLWLEEIGKEKSGLNVLEKIRENEKFNNTRIVIISADDKAEVRKNCTRLGADGFLSKPFDLNEAQDTIKEALGINK